MARGRGGRQPVQLADLVSVEADLAFAGLEQLFDAPAGAGDGYEVCGGTGRCDQRR
jgi:hypothetical protein